MIQPVNSPVLSSAKPRSGFQKISDLIPRLIRQYEIQADIARARQLEAAEKVAAMQDAAMIREAKAALFADHGEAWLNGSAPQIPTINGEASHASAVQQSFGW